MCCSLNMFCMLCYVIFWPFCDVMFCYMLICYVLYVMLYYAPVCAEQNRTAQNREDRQKGLHLDDLKGLSQVFYWICYVWYVMLCPATHVMLCDVMQCYRMLCYVCMWCSVSVCPEQNRTKHTRQNIHHGVGFRIWFKWLSKCCLKNMFCMLCSFMCCDVCDVMICSVMFSSVLIFMVCYVLCMYVQNRTELHWTDITHRSDCIYIIVKWWFKKLCY